jgi:uncharacterized DUF497 family protein
VDFEFDPERSTRNKLKHGIDFIEAQAIWQDEDAVEAPAHNVLGESRMLRVGLIGSALWTAIFMVRGGNIRIISVRKPHENERRAYRAYND